MQQHIDNLLNIKTSTDINYAIMMCVISSMSGQQYLSNEIDKATAKTRFSSQLQSAELRQISDNTIKTNITNEIQSMLNLVS